MSLPEALGGTGLVVWRLDQNKHASSWNTGQGAFLNGGRWNRPGTRAVYCAFSAATAVLEVAVHKGFGALDAVRHTLTALQILDAASIRVVRPEEVPNANWLRPGMPSAAQQAFGDDLLNTHAFVALPSAVAQRSWNLIFVDTRAASAYRFLHQEDFALDTRLNPPSA